MISTPRLLLRPLDPEQQERAPRGCAPAPGVGLRADGPSEELPDDLAALLARRFAVRFAVEHARSGELLGRCGLHHWPELDEAEIGWMLNPGAQGRGYAAEAAGAVLTWGFAHLDVGRCTARIPPTHAPSRRLATRLGFTPHRTEALLGTEFTVYALDRPEAARRG